MSKRWVGAGFVVVLLLIFLGGLGPLKDSFIYRNSPSPHGTAGAGVVFYDRLRAQKDYLNVAIDGFRDCIVMDMEGKPLYTFKGGNCYFYQDGSVFMTANALGNTLFDPSGKPLWINSDWSHHDLFVDEQTKEVFFPINEDRHLDGRKMIGHSVVGFDGQGKEIFRWSADDHIKELSEAREEPIVLGDSGRANEFFHINTVQVLPATPLEAQDPAFKRGNILVNCFRTRLIFILERESGKIVWSHFFRDDRLATNDTQQQSGAHTVHMLPNGHMLFILNKAAYSYTSLRFSEVIEMNPLTHETVWRYKADPAGDFYTDVWGGAYLLENGNVLVTNSTAGSAFEITRRGRLVWEWINPHQDLFGMPYPVYRVTRVRKDVLLKTIKNWELIE